MQKFKNTTGLSSRTLGLTGGQAMDVAAPLSVESRVRKLIDEATKEETLIQTLTLIILDRSTMPCHLNRNLIACLVVIAASTHVW